MSGVKDPFVVGPIYLLSLYLQKSIHETSGRPKFRKTDLVDSQGLGERTEDTEESTRTVVQAGPVSCVHRGRRPPLGVPVVVVRDPRRDGPGGVVQGRDRRPRQGRLRHGRVHDKTPPLEAPSVDTTGLDVSVAGLSPPRVVNVKAFVEEDLGGYLALPQVPDHVTVPLG